MRQELRQHQLDGIAAVLASFRRVRRTLLVSPTGSGKTTLAAEIVERARRKGSKVLFVAHRRELIQQASARLDQWDVDHGIIMRGHPRARPKCCVQVASIQTLVRRETHPGAYDLIIVDEAHRSLAPSYRALRDTGAWVLGLTATPCRTDGGGLGDYYDELVQLASPAALADAGYLMRPRIWSGAPPALAGIHSRGGDYVQAELQLATGQAALLADVVPTHQRIVGRGKRTLCYAVGVEHSLTLASEYAAAGYRAAHIDGGTPTAERDAVLARLAGGDLEVVCNCSVLTEGWDLPALDCVQVARPTKSLGLWLQMAGRVLRPAPGKQSAAVIDHGGNALLHGGPMADRAWTLDRGAPEPTEPGLSRCEQCWRVLEAGERVCPECGAVKPAPEPKPAPRPEAGNLREMSDAELERAAGSAAPARIAALAEWLGTGRKEGYAWMMHNRRYGYWPTGAERELARRRAGEV